MARETDFAQATSERALQAARFGTTWASEFAEESFKQGKLAFDGFLRVTRKMAEDWESQASTIREQATTLTEKTLSTTMDFGQKLSRAKQPQEFVQYQSDYLARQAQTLADGTKEFGEKVQQAARSFASNASSAMAEASRRGEEMASNIGSHTEQSRRQQQRAEA